MKLKSTLQKTKMIMALGFCGSLLMSQPAVASGNWLKESTLSTNGEEEPAKKSKAKARAKAKAFASLNNQSVKIFPDVLNRNMHVIAKDNNGKEIDFFVFDLQGTLVQNYKMKARDHNKISGLARGTYVYRVFCGDEETAAGKFEIR